MFVSNATQRKNETDEDQAFTRTHQAKVAACPPQYLVGIFLSGENPLIIVSDFGENASGKSRVASVNMRSKRNRDSTTLSAPFPVTISCSCDGHGVTALPLPHNSATRKLRNRIFVDGSWPCNWIVPGNRRLPFRGFSCSGRVSVQSVT